jgi:hypothetical protein
VKPHARQLVPAGVVLNEHVHEAVIEAGEPELLGGGNARECTLVLREYGYPPLLPGGEWTVVENNNLPAPRLPTAGGELRHDRVELVAMLTELVAGDDRVLQLGKAVERRSGCGRGLRHG